MLATPPAGGRTPELLEQSQKLRDGGVRVSNPHPPAGNVNVGGVMLQTGREMFPTVVGKHELLNVGNDPVPVGHEVEPEPVDPDPVDPDEPVEPVEPVVVEPDELDEPVVVDPAAPEPEAPPLEPDPDPEPEPVAPVPVDPVVPVFPMFPLDEDDEPPAAPDGLEADAPGAPLTPVTPVAPVLMVETPLIEAPERETAPAELELVFPSETEIELAAKST
jgi:hypothetical protein